MSPKPSVCQGTGRRGGNSEMAGYVFVYHACATHLSDGKNVFVRKVGLVMPGANHPPTETKLIRLIFQRCRPAQVGRTIVRAVTIPVGDVVGFRWPGAVERGAYNSMHRYRHAVDSDEMIPFAERWLEDFSKEEIPPSASVNEGSVNRSDTSKARSLIARMPRYCAPLFNLCYRVLSHVALLQRSGQGVTTGWRLSSSPQFTLAPCPQQGAM